MPMLNEDSKYQNLSLIGLRALFLAERIRKQKEAGLFGLRGVAKALENAENSKQSSLDTSTVSGNAYKNLDMLFREKPEKANK